MPNTIFDPETDDQKDTLKNTSKNNINRGIDELESYANQGNEQPKEEGSASSSSYAPDVDDFESSYSQGREPDTDSTLSTQPWEDDDQSQTTTAMPSLYTGGGDAADKQPLPSKLKTALTKKRSIAGIVITALVGGGLFGLTILQGPLQFVHMSQLLTSFHMGPVDSFSDARTARFMLRAAQGRTAEGRMGRHGNKRADKWEARLNQNGLRTVYSPGTQRGIGYAITDPVKARSFISEARAQGLDVDARFPDGSRGIRVEDGNFRMFRRVTRLATRSVGLNKVSSALGSRLLSRRTGTNGLFHPFRDIARRQADKLAWRRDQKDAERNKHLAGDADIDFTQTRLGRLRTRMGNILKTSKGGPLVAAGIYCSVSGMSEQIEEQDFQNQLAMMRMGVDSVSKGEQVRKMEDFNLEVLGVASENMWNEENNTSWTDDPGVQYEMGKAPTGHDYLEEKDIKPRATEKPIIFDVVDTVESVPLFDTVAVRPICGAFEVTGRIVSSIPGAGVLNNIMGGAIRTLTTKSPDEWNDWLVARYATGGVDPHAEGSEWGGLVNSGLRLAANDQMIASGGRELEPEEANLVKQDAREIREAEFAGSGFVNRYFNVFDNQSFVAKLFQKTPSNRTQLVVAVGNLPSTVAKTIHSSVTGSEPVYAAETYDYGFPLYGFSLEEQQMFDDPFANAEYIESDGRLQRLNEEYGQDCFGMTISENGDLQYGETQSFTKIEDKCASDDPELLAYRMYIADIITVHTLDCYEGFSEDSCRQLGFENGGTSNENQTTLSGLESPPNLVPANSEGYYQMPSSTDGSYRLNTNGGSPASEQCGSKELVDVVYTLLNKYNDVYGEVLGVGDLNATGHSSHKTGVDVDIYASPYNASIMADHEKAVQLGKWAYDTGIVETIGYSYPDEVNSKVNAYAGSDTFMQNWSGHKDHFHIRLLPQFEGPVSTSCAE